MSYTTFAYSNLRVSIVSQFDSDSRKLEEAWSRGVASPNVVGGVTAIWLHRPLVQVSFEVKNTGAVAGGG